MDDIDVIFLGDSITEGWQGHFLSRSDDRVQGALEVFRHYFSKKHKGKYEGLPQVGFSHFVAFVSLISILKYLTINFVYILDHISQ